MGQIFSLLTIVSNNSANSVPNWVSIAIQCSMWLAVATQIFLLVPDLIYAIKTKNTVNNKWFKWIVWFICSAAWITYSLLLLYESLPVQEIIGLCVSEGFNLICLFAIYGIKIYNIVKAKKNHMTEKQWCALMFAKYLARKRLTKKTLKSLGKISRRLTKKERAQLYKKSLKGKKAIKKAAKKNKKTH